MTNRYPVQERLPATRMIGIGAVGIASFHLAFIYNSLSFLIVVYVWALYQMRLLPSNRTAFFAGSVVGVLCFGPQLWFFWTLFGVKSIALWSILGVWIGLFVLLARHCAVTLSPVWAGVVIPWLWLGLEYFRGELYYLRFSWFGPGFAFAHMPNPGSLLWLGSYGVGFLLVALVAIESLLPRRRAVVFAVAVIGGLAIWTNLPKREKVEAGEAGKVLKVAGVQLEFPGVPELIKALDKLVRKHSDAPLVVLSEYSFDGPIPDRVKRWCREHGKYLIAGGKEPAGEDFYNTAYVVAPDGEVCFKQAKMVPVQFFVDGRPAVDQALWSSPWGKIGISICYDSSYRRVMDRLVELGAQAIISPMMDIETWGVRQHTLHARVPPIRASEYGIPIFRVGSSGISQLIDGDGDVRATANFPGQEETIAGEMRLSRAGKLPLDYWPCRLAVLITGGMIGHMIILSFRKWRSMPKRV